MPNLRSNPPQTKFFRSTNFQSKNQADKAKNQADKTKKKRKYSDTGIGDDNEKKNFVEELANSWIDIDKPKKEQLTLTDISTYLFEKDFTLSYARGIMQDFTEILKKESLKSDDKTGIKERGIYADIKTNCRKNLQKNNICFCCGEPITATSLDKACDHVIPIITMLITVDPDTVINNLHFIHKKCNTIKSNLDIWTIYNNIGRLDGIFGEHIKKLPVLEDRNKRINNCKERFMGILKSIKIRPKWDIINREDIVKNLNENCFRNLKDYVNHYLNPSSAAEILLQMKERENEKEEILLKIRNSNTTLSRYRIYPVSNSSVGNLTKKRKKLRKLRNSNKSKKQRSARSDAAAAATSALLKLHQGTY